MMIGMNRLPRVCRRKNHEIMKIGDERFSVRNICATLYDDSHEELKPSQESAGISQRDICDVT